MSERKKELAPWAQAELQRQRANRPSRHELRAEEREFLAAVQDAYIASKAEEDSKTSGKVTKVRSKDLPAPVKVIPDGHSVLSLGMGSAEYIAPSVPEGTLFNLTSGEAEDIRSRVLRYAQSASRRAGLTDWQNRAEDIAQDAVLRAMLTSTVEYAEKRIQELAQAVADGIPDAQDRLNQWAGKSSLAVAAVTHRANGIVRKVVQSLARQEDRTVSLDVNPASATANEHYAHEHLARRAMIECREDTEQFFQREDTFRAMRNATPAQAKVLTCILNGQSEADTARRLNLNRSTVKRHMDGVRTLFARYA
jgi:DNA-binding CsgD family transcriptional regulator